MKFLDKFIPYSLFTAAYAVVLSMAALVLISVWRMIFNGI